MASSPDSGHPPAIENSSATTTISTREESTKVTGPDNNSNQQNLGEFPQTRSPFDCQCECPASEDDRHGVVNLYTSVDDHNK